MLRMFKVFALALGATLVLAATAVAAPEFTYGAEKSTVIGTQSAAQKFKFTNSEVSCSTSTFHGGVVSPTKSTQIVGVIPVYTNCVELALGVAAKITGFGHYGEANTCFYVIRAAGTIDLNCAAGADVTIEWGTCVVHIPAQVGIAAVKFANGVGVNGKKDVTVEFQINNITGTHTDGFLCPFNGGGNFNNGSLTGSSTAEAFEEGTGKAIDLIWDA